MAAVRHPRLAAAAAAALGAAALFWGTGERAPVQPVARPTATQQQPSRMALQTAPAPPAAATGAVESPTIVPQQPAGTDPSVVFAAAVKAAQEAPIPAPPPGVAEASTFEQAFDAMKEAERPPAAAAGISPFSGR